MSLHADSSAMSTADSVKLDLAALDESTSSDDSNEQNATVNFRKTALDADGPKIHGRGWKKQQWDISDMYGGQDSGSGGKDGKGAGDSGKPKRSRRESQALSGALHGLMIGQLIEEQTAGDNKTGTDASNTTSTNQGYTIDIGLGDDEFSDDEPLVAKKDYLGIVQGSGRWDVGVATDTRDAPSLVQIREFLEDMERQADAIEVELRKAPDQIKAKYGETLDNDIRKIEAELEDHIDSVELAYGQELQAKREEQHRELEKEIFSRRADLHASRKALVEQAIKEAIASHDKQLQALLGEAKRLEHRVKIDDDVVAHLRARIGSLDTLLQKPPPPRRPPPVQLAGSKDSLTTTALSTLVSTPSTGSVQPHPLGPDGGVGQEGDGIIMQPDAPLPSAGMFGSKGLTAIIEEDEEDEYEEGESEVRYGADGQKLSLWEIAPDASSPGSTASWSGTGGFGKTNRSPRPSGVSKLLSYASTTVNDLPEEEEEEEEEETEGSSVPDSTKDPATPKLDEKQQREVDLRNLLHRELDTQDDIHVYLLEARYEAIDELLRQKQAKEVLDLKVGHLEDLVIPFERARARFSTLNKKASEVDSRVSRLREAYAEWHLTSQQQAHEQTRRLMDVADQNSNLLMQLQSAETKFISEQELRRQRELKRGDDSSSSSSSSSEDLPANAQLGPGAHTARRLRKRGRRREKGKHAPAPKGPDWISRTNNAWRVRTAAAHDNPLNAIQSHNQAIRLMGNTQANARYAGGLLAPYEKKAGDRGEIAAKKQAKKKRNIRKGVRFAQEDEDLEEYGAKEAGRRAQEEKERRAAERIMHRMSIKAIWSSQEDEYHQQQQQQQQGAAGTDTLTPYPPPPGTIRRQRVSLAAAAARMNTPRSWDARTRLPVLEDGVGDATAKLKREAGKASLSVTELARKRIEDQTARKGGQRSKEDAPRLTSVIDPLDGQVHGQLGLTAKMAEQGKGQFFNKKPAKLDATDQFVREQQQRLHGDSSPTSSPGRSAGGGAGLNATEAAVRDATRRRGAGDGGERGDRRIHTHTYGADKTEKEFQHPSAAYYDQFSSAYGLKRHQAPGNTAPTATVEEQLRTIAKEYLQRVIYGDDDVAAQDTGKDTLTTTGGGDKPSLSSQSAAKALLQFHALRSSEVE
eukprot:TRINITY_DN3090_c1_g2_i2.p1 TRINITY_DN3090_c1_g2~~TRINITY_DN3090_c1_g2_i2.p1  ORF type:complete len:1144 (+),score=324.30 TRINITY_DN3090_c1_g2_i2:408-3839(+)